MEGSAGVSGGGAGVSGGFCLGEWRGEWKSGAGVRV